MIDLGTRYKESARAFLQTAIVIDDEADLGGPKQIIIPERLQSPTSDVLELSAEPETLAVGTVAEPKIEPAPSALNAKVLSEAFLEEKMICGLYRPVPGEDMVKQASGAARAADIVVVDWNLEPGRSGQARDIILNILRADQAEKGRLRLIAIYTSQPGRVEIAKELLKDLEADAQLKGRLKLDGPALTGPTTRVVVLNKRNTHEAGDRLEVVEEALPGKLVDEFAALSQGVIPSFALASIAAVRKGAHHVLAHYTAELDGAFVAHRCGIPHPDDSKGLALDMITSELRNLIEVEDVAEQTLGAEVIQAWVERKVTDKVQFRSGKAEAPADLVRKLVSEGARALTRLDQRSLVNTADPPGKGNEITNGSLTRIFYPDAAAAETSAYALSRLSTFQREPTRTHLPDAWVPKLTLGSVIQRLDGAAEQILVCMQPRCDSIRLEGATAFPFQTVQDEAHFNLVIEDMAGMKRPLWVKLKPRDALMLRFVPDQVRKAILAVREQDGQRYVFVDESGARFMWLGDLKSMKAQRWAGELGTRIQTVGMEELEWLRTASESKISKSWSA